MIAASHDPAAATFQSGMRQVTRAVLGQGLVLYIGKSRVTRRASARTLPAPPLDRTKVDMMEPAI